MYLMFLLQAAMDFLVAENLKAHVSCWYIKKYIEDHPLQHYKDLVITWLQPVGPVWPGMLPQINYNLMCLLMYRATEAKHGM